MKRPVRNVSEPLRIDIADATQRIWEWPHLYRASVCVILALVLLAATAVFVLATYGAIGRPALSRVPDIRLGDKYYRHKPRAMEVGDGETVYLSTADSLETYNPKSYVWHSYTAKDVSGAFPFGADDLAYVPKTKHLYMLSNKEKVWSCPVDEYRVYPDAVQQRIVIGDPWENLTPIDTTAVSAAVLDKGKVYTAVYGGGLGLYDPAAHGWSVYPVPQQHLNVRDMHLGDTLIWLATDGGVFVADRSTQEAASAEYQLDAPELVRLKVENDRSAVALMKDRGLYVFDGAWRGPFLGGEAFEGATDENAKTALLVDNTIVTGASGVGIGFYNVRLRRWFQQIAVKDIPLDATAEFREIVRLPKTVVARTSMGLLYLDTPEPDKWAVERIGEDAVADVAASASGNGVFYVTDSGALKYHSRGMGTEPITLVSDSRVELPNSVDAVSEIGDVIDAQSKVYIGLRQGGILQYGYLDHNLDLASSYAGQGDIAAIEPVSNFFTNGPQVFALADGLVLSCDGSANKWAQRTPPGMTIKSATADANHLFALDTAGVLHVFTGDGILLRSFFEGEFAGAGANAFPGDLIAVRKDLGAVALLGSGNNLGIYNGRTRGWEEPIALPPNRTIVKTAVPWGDFGASADAGQASEGLSAYAGTAPAHAFYIDTENGVGYDASAYLGGAPITGGLNDFLQVSSVDNDTVMVHSKTGLYRYRYSQAGFEPLPLPSDFNGDVRSLTQWGAQILLASSTGGLWYSTGLEQQWNTIVSQSANLTIGKELILFANEQGQYFNLSNGQTEPRALTLFLGSAPSAAAAQWALKGKEDALYFVAGTGMSRYNLADHSFLTLNLPPVTVNQAILAGGQLAAATEQGLISTQTGTFDTLSTVLADRNVYWLGNGDAPLALARKGNDFEVYRFSGSFSAEPAPELTFSQSTRFPGDLGAGCYARDIGGKLMVVDRKGHCGLYEPSSAKWEAREPDGAGNITVDGRLDTAAAIVLVATDTAGQRVLYRLAADAAPAWLRFSPSVPAQLRKVQLGGQSLWTVDSTARAMEYDLGGTTSEATDWMANIRGSLKAAPVLEKRLNEFRAERERWQSTLDVANRDIADKQRQQQQLASQLGADVQNNLGVDYSEAAAEKERARIEPLVENLKKKSQALETERKTAENKRDEIQKQHYELQAQLAKKEEDARRATDTASAMQNALSALADAEQPLTISTVFSKSDFNILKDMTPRLPRSLQTDEKFAAALDEVANAQTNVESKEKEVAGLENARQTIEQTLQSGEAQRRLGARDLTFDQIESVFDEVAGVTVSGNAALAAAKSALDQDKARAMQTVRGAIGAVIAHVQNLVDDLKKKEGQATSEVDGARNAVAKAVADLATANDELQQLTNDCQATATDLAGKTRDAGSLQEIARLAKEIVAQQNTAKEATDKAAYYRAQYELFDWTAYWQGANVLDCAVRAEDERRFIGVLTDKGCFQFAIAGKGPSGVGACQGRLATPPGTFSEIAWSGKEMAIGTMGAYTMKALLNPDMADPNADSNWSSAAGASISQPLPNLPIAADTQPATVGGIQFVPAAPGGGGRFEIQVGGTWQEAKTTDGQFNVDRVKMVALGDNENLLVFTDDGIGVRNLQKQAADRFSRMLSQNALGVGDGIDGLRSRLNCMALPGGQCWSFSGGTIAPAATPSPEVVYEDKAAGFSILQSVNGMMTEPAAPQLFAASGKFAFDDVGQIAINKGFGHFKTPWGVWTVTIDSQKFAPIALGSQGALVQADSDDAYWEKDGGAYQYTSSGGGFGSWTLFQPKSPEFTKVAQTGPWIWEGHYPQTGVRIYFDPSVQPGNVVRTMTAGRFDDDRFLCIDAAGDRAILGTGNGAWEWIPTGETGQRRCIGHLGVPVTTVEVQGGRVYVQAGGVALCADAKSGGGFPAWQPGTLSTGPQSFSIGAVRFTQSGSDVRLDSSDSTVSVWDGQRFYFDKVAAVESYKTDLWTGTEHGGVLAYRLSGDLVDARAYTRGSGLPSNETAAFAVNKSELFLRTSVSDCKWSGTAWSAAGGGVTMAERAQGIGLSWRRVDLFAPGVQLWVANRQLASWLLDGRLAFDNVQGAGAYSQNDEHVLWACGKGLAHGKLDRVSWAEDNRPVCTIAEYDESLNVHAVDVCERAGARYVRSQDGSTFSRGGTDWIRQDANLFTHPVPRLAPAGSEGWAWKPAEIDQAVPQTISAAPPLKTSPLSTRACSSFDCALSAVVQESSTMLVQSPAQVILNRYSLAKDNEPAIVITQPLPPTDRPTVDITHTEDGKPLVIAFATQEDWQVWAFEQEAWKPRNELVELFKRRIASLQAVPFGWKDERILDPLYEVPAPYLQNHPRYRWIVSVPGGARFAFDVLNRVAAEGANLYLGTEGGALRYEPDPSGGLAAAALLLTDKPSADYAVRAVLDLNGKIYAQMTNKIRRIENNSLIDSDLDYDPFTTFWVGGIFGKSKFEVSTEGTLLKDGRSTWASGMLNLGANSFHSVESVLKFEPSRSRQMAWVLGSTRLYLLDGE